MGWRGAPISSYLGVHALRIGSSWFIYFNRDDFPSRVVDRLDALNRETATEAVGRMCSAEQTSTSTTARVGLESIRPYGTSGFWNRM